MSLDMSSVMELLSGGNIEGALQRLETSGDPLVAQMANLMRQQRSLRDIEVTPAATDISRARDLDAIKVALDAAHVELEILRRRNRHLAFALGACECFGENAACPACGGLGRSGTYRVSARMFHRMVMPAAEQVCTPATQTPPNKEERP